MKTEKTIQSQMIKTLAVLAIAVVVILGVGIYVIYGAKDPLQQAVRDYDRSRDQIFEIRLALDRIDLAYQLAYKSKSDSASANRDLAKEESKKLVGLLDGVAGSLAEQQSAVQQIESFRASFLEVVGRESSTATSSVSSKSNGAIGRAESTGNSFESLRSELDILKAKNKAHYEIVFAQKLRSIVFLIVPILLSLLILPLSTFWSATRKINLDLIGYIRSLYQFSEENEDSSEELRASSELMSSASSQQSAAIQQSVSSIAEIRAMLAETEIHVREVQSLTAEMNDETNKGSEILQRLEKSMHAIEETNSQIASFEEILNAIRGKTQVIKDIVFKTQLLSFNASIEAARAGHYGRGFSVVAEEVGKLAMMSGDASKEIDLLLTQSGDRVSRIVESVQDRVGDGKTVSHEVLKKFGHLAIKLSGISEKIDQVAAATVEQGIGIEQTAKAMEQVNQGAAENKRGSEEVHRIADRISELSAKIRNVTGGIRKFVVESKRTSKSDQSLQGIKSRPVERSDSNPNNTSEETRNTVLSLAIENGRKPALKNASSQRPTSKIMKITADDPSFRKAGSGE
jgi:hypothetical protein